MAKMVKKIGALARIDDDPITLDTIINDSSEKKQPTTTPTDEDKCPRVVVCQISHANLTGIYRTDNSLESIITTWMRSRVEDEMYVNDQCYALDCILSRDDGVYAVYVLESIHEEFSEFILSLEIGSLLGVQRNSNFISDHCWYDALPSKKEHRKYK
jgi:hypothetical protein